LWRTAKLAGHRPGQHGVDKLQTEQNPVSHESVPTACGGNQEWIMTSELSNLDLVKWYFNVCNTALATPDANPVVSLVESLLVQAVPNRDITIEVVDDAQKHLGYYTTRFVDGSFLPVQEGDRDPDSHYRLRRSFLKSVVEDSDDYIEHPERLDWSWITRA
jgi:hypothetical protein